VSKRLFNAELIEHYKRHAGKYIGAEPATVNGPDRGYSLGFFENAEDEMITVISSGLRFKDIDVAWQEELSCTLQSEQASYARFLVDITCELILEQKRGVEFDYVLDNGGELIEGTQIEGLIASPHPYFEADFNVRFNRSGDIEMQIITLVPATRPEIEFVSANEADALYEIWVQQATDLLDVDRPSAV
jgi:hypothetical protein